MFDVGFWEVVLVGVIALIVLGPERMPRALRVLGFWMGRARAMYYSVRAELDREFQIQEMRKAGRDYEEELERNLRQYSPKTENEARPEAGESAAGSESASQQDKDKGANP